MRALVQRRARPARYITATRLILIINTLLESPSDPPPHLPPGRIVRGKRRPPVIEHDCDARGNHSRRRPRPPRHIDSRARAAADRARHGSRRPVARARVAAAPPPRPRCPLRGGRDLHHRSVEQHGFLVLRHGAESALRTSTPRTAPTDWSRGTTLALDRPLCGSTVRINDGGGNMTARAAPQHTAGQLIQQQRASRMSTTWY